MRPGVSANGEAGQSLGMICPRNRQYRAGRRGRYPLQAVQTLPQDQREAVVLFYYEDLPTEEIARIRWGRPRGRCGSG